MSYDISSFPNINNKMIDRGLRLARVERSRAFYTMIEGLFGGHKKRRDLFEG